MAKHSAVARLWARKIENGEKIFDETPARLKDEVKEILIENGFMEPDDETDNNTTEETDKSSTDSSDETSKSE